MVGRNRPQPVIRRVERAHWRAFPYPVQDNPATDREERNPCMDQATNAPAPG